MDESSALDPSSIPAVGGGFPSFGGSRPAGAKPANWAGNVEFGAERVHFPESVEQVQSVVRRSRKVRALGWGHSFSRIADCAGDLVSLRRMNGVVGLDPVASTVTVQAGISYGELSAYLHANGHALHNLPSTPHVSVAGACATATHGSGLGNGNLATAVSAIQFVDGAGEVVTLARGKDGDAFQGAVVALGGLGAVTALTLDVQPAFDVAQAVYRDLAMGELENHFHAIVSSGYSVSLFTDWAGNKVNQVWIKRRAGDGGPAPGSDFHGARPATRNVHPVEGHPAENTTEQMGVPGPWHERLPHFRMGCMPSIGRELHSEYFVPLEHGIHAIRAMQALQERLAPHLFVSELRTVAADGLWMSPCYGRACLAVHTTWKPEWEHVIRLLPLMEEKLAPYEAVPHWGKLFTMRPAALRSRFARLPDFRALLARYDPGGKFRNDFLDRYVHPA
ncbi:MAG TPA: FAD-binding protein [Longimicrobium sp.]|nr:FAD-binding protein [Longimicrobium sp.]